MSDVSLYQFELCPFCHKVKAGLEIKGIPYRTVEVNPMSKKELPGLPEDAPKKVPVLASGDDIVFDSTDILHYLDQHFDSGPSLLPQDDAQRERTVEVENWVDEEFAVALPTVIYGTWGEALKAAQVTARSSNFGFLQNVGVRAGGPLIMHQVAKRILKKRGKKDGHAWVQQTLDQFDEWIAEQPFVAGDSITMGDVAMHGAVSCVRDFPIFETIMARPKTSAWYRRVSELRDSSKRLN